MAIFSERMGLKPPPTDLSIEEFPDRLRNQLWNALRIDIFNDAQIADPYTYQISDLLGSVYIAIWCDYLGNDIDRIYTDPSSSREHIKGIFWNANYAVFYDLIEVIFSLFDIQGASNYLNEDQLRNSLNEVLESNRAAVRIVHRQVLPITNSEERGEVEVAMMQAHFSSASTHLKTAASKYSSQNPDYRNSVKESISAVESAIAEATGRNAPDSDRPFRELKEQYEMHPAFADGFKKLFAWTSDENGIRHALMEGARDITQAEARLMLICASAFVNYLITLRSNT